MTDDQINQAIAKACGWECLAPDVWHHGIVGYSKDTHGIVRSRIPDYCTDLNAMHEAESMLHRKKPEFSEILLELVSEAAGVGVQYAHGSFAHVHAPARLRAEAFLRTLGKWEKEAK